MRLPWSSSGVVLRLLHLLLHSYISSHNDFALFSLLFSPLSAVSCCSVFRVTLDPGFICQIVSRPSEWRAGMRAEQIHTQINVKAVKRSRRVWAATVGARGGKKTGGVRWDGVSGCYDSTVIRNVSEKSHSPFILYINQSYRGRNTNTQSTETLTQLYTCKCFNGCEKLLQVHPIMRLSFCKVTSTGEEGSYWTRSQISWVSHLIKN